MNRFDQTQVPKLTELGIETKSPLWERLCGDLARDYGAKPVLAYSRCSWEPGWNVKFKKTGKTLCTLYPKEGFFTVLIVIGEKEKPGLLELFPALSPQLRELYQNTKEGMGQRWLMVDVAGSDETRLQEIKSLISLRRPAGRAR